jgi:hypothetical protein
MGQGQQGMPATPAVFPQKLTSQHRFASVRPGALLQMVTCVQQDSHPAAAKQTHANKKLPTRQHMQADALGAVLNGALHQKHDLVVPAHNG